MNGSIIFVMISQIVLHFNDHGKKMEGLLKFSTQEPLDISIRFKSSVVFSVGFIKLEIYLNRESF